MKSQKVVKEGKSNLIPGSERKLTRVDITDLKKDPHKTKTVIKNPNKGKEDCGGTKKTKTKDKRGVIPTKTYKNKKPYKNN